MASISEQILARSNRHAKFLNKTIVQFFLRARSKDNFFADLEEDFQSVFTRLKGQLNEIGRFRPSELKDCIFKAHDAMFWLLDEIFQWAETPNEGVYMLRKIFSRVREQSDFVFEAPYILGHW